MNIDINKILNLANTFMPNKVKDLQIAIEKAQTILKNSADKSPEEILRNTGISSNFIDKLRQNTSNPIAEMFMKAIGLDVNKANSILDNIRSSYNVSNPISSYDSDKKDDIETLKQGLKKVKKN